MQKYTVRPVVLAHKANAQGITSIRIAVTVNRKVTYMVTEHRIHTSQWDDKKREVVNHENGQLINIALRRRVADVERELIGMNLEGVQLNKQAIKNGTTPQQVRFAKFAREVRGNEKELNRLASFAGDSFLLSDVTPAFLRKYEQHEKRRGMANNTINTSFKYVRRIITQAFKEKLIKENPFDSYDIPRYRQTDRIYLTKDELERFMGYVGQLTGSLRNTGYFFLLGCYTGLRHSDWQRFNYETMVNDGFIRIRAKKNKKHVVLPIGLTLASILESVKDLPPPVSNQKCNVMLKAIAAGAGLKKQLTTHAARHSFGYMCASNKIPKSVTAELMGISTQTVEVYYHLSGENIIQQAAVLKTL